MHAHYIQRFYGSNLLQSKETNRPCFLVRQPPSYAFSIENTLVIERGIMNFKRI